MTVTARGSGFQATVHHKGERYRRQFTTQAEALAWENEAKAALAKGNLPDMGDGDSGGPATLEALKDLTYRLKWTGTKAADTALMNASICIRDIGNISPLKVNTNTIDSLIFKWQDDGKSDATINRRLSALSTMLKVARDRGYLAHLPRIERRKEVEKRIRFFTPEEERKILNWFAFTGNQDMVDLVTVAIDTGMRRGELQRLEGRAIHGNLIMVHFTKNKNKTRTVPMTSRVKAVLEARRERLGDGKLFDLTDDCIRYAWDTMRLKLFPNDEHAVFHTLRHTFVSRLVQRGVNLKKVADLAGHTQIKTTMRYAHLAPEDLEEAIKVLEPA